MKIKTGKKIGDLGILCIAFLISLLIKRYALSQPIPPHFWIFSVFVFLWIIISLVTGKYVDYNPDISVKKINYAILLSNAIMFGLTTALVYFFRLDFLSQFILLSTFLIATFLEIVVTLIYYYNKRLTQRAKEHEKYNLEIKLSHKQYIESEDSNPTTLLSSSCEEHKKLNKLRNLITDEAGEEVFKFIYSQNILSEPLATIISTTTRFNILSLPETYNALINLKKINDIQRINKFFEEINNKLNPGALFIGFAETSELRKHRIHLKYKGFWRFIYFFDFILHRVLPKLSFSKNIYFKLTRGTNRVISKAETLGRLVSCGFEIKEYHEGSKLLFFIAKKTGNPYFDMNPSYGPLFKMRRIGKGDAPIYIYKFRTMHPYAEYLQDYILKVNGYSEVGKPADDFRLTSWGKFFRKYWLDELPQILNVLKGEMKLVGIRPLSKRFLKEYPEDVLKLRSKYKPGCIPPYVALLKQEVSEYIESERIYLLEKEKHPFTTDIKYFCKALYNILSNKIRSA